MSNHLDRMTDRMQRLEAWHIHAPGLAQLVERMSRYGLHAHVGPERVARWSEDRVAVTLDPPPRGYREFIISWGGEGVSRWDAMHTGRAHTVNHAVCAVKSAVRKVEAYEPFVGTPHDTIDDLIAKTARLGQICSRVEQSSAEWAGGLMEASICISVVSDATVIIVSGGPRPKEFTVVNEAVEYIDETIKGLT